MSSGSGEQLPAAAWIGGALVPAEGQLSEEQVLQRVDRIRTRWSGLSHSSKKSVEDFTALTGPTANCCLRISQAR